VAVGLLALSACSVANLSYAEVQRDLDAIVFVAEPEDEPQLAYRDEAQLAPWYARSWLLLPVKWLLLSLFTETVDTTLENPSGAVRELAAELAPKAGRNLVHTVRSTQRLVRIAELDPSALNRMVALDGLALSAAAHGFDLTDGLQRGQEWLQPDPELTDWIDGFAELRPAARPAGTKLTAEQAARYHVVLSGLTVRPLSNWQSRLALRAELTQALAQEHDPELRRLTTNRLRRALAHAIQATVVAALVGQDPDWVDVRLRALELLHRAGGADTVPLLLALMSSSAERIAAGDPPFDPDLFVQRRLIHICGQLNRERAGRSLLLPGDQEWQRVSPLDFLARIVLDDGAFLSPLALPAREALARCLGRQRLELADDQGEDWVRSWYDQYRRQS